MSYLEEFEIDLYDEGYDESEEESIFSEWYGEDVLDDDEALLEEWIDGSY